MSEANYTACANAKANIITLAENLTLQRDESGRYMHDKTERFKNLFLFLLQLWACYNDTQPGKGMKKLIEAGNNELTTIKSTDRVTADTVLAAAKQEAAALKRSTGMEEKPRFETRAEAKIEADDCNYVIQATIGTKEGVAVAISKIVGTDITDNVLKHADGTPKGVDKYRLSEIFDAVAAAAKRPKESKMLALKVASLQYRFDWQKSLQVNMEQFHLHVNKVTSYQLTFDNNECVLVLLANVDEATKHDYGREFCEVLRGIRQKYRYDAKHDAASLADILNRLTAADTLRDTAEAPAPESANAVANSMALLSDFVAGSDINEYEEAALGVTSESDSSCHTKHTARNNKKKHNKDNKSDNRHSSHACSKSRDSCGVALCWQDNPCKHCKAMKRHSVHKDIREKDCYWNPGLNVYRPHRVCDEMEIPFVPACKFESDSEDK